MAEANQMKTVGDLLTRDLSRKIEEIIQVDQAYEQSPYAETTKSAATDSIREQYHDLLKAVAEAPSEPHESVGVWVSGFFGSGKRSLAGPKEARDPDAHAFVRFAGSLSDGFEEIVVLFTDTIGGGGFRGFSIGRLLVRLIDLDDLLDLAAEITCQQIANCLHLVCFSHRF